MRNFLIGSLLLSLSIVASAADAESLLSGDFDGTSRNDRVAVARDLKAEVLKLAHYLPTQRPQEISSVKKEQDEARRLSSVDVAASTLRYTKIAQSPEYQHIKLNDILGKITDALDCVITEMDALPREMLCWSTAAFHLTDSQTIQNAVGILLKSGRLDPQAKKGVVLGPESLGFGFWLQQFGRGILESILMPHLKQQIK